VSAVSDITPVTVSINDPALVEQANELLDLAVPDGEVAPAVADKFLDKLRAVVEAHRPEAGQWEVVGLGGARWIVTFQNAETAGAAALYLMTHDHGHHFAVTGEGRKIIMSKLATECLVKEFGPTGQPLAPPRTPASTDGRT